MSSFRITVTDLNDETFEIGADGKEREGDYFEGKPRAAAIEADRRADLWEDLNGSVVITVTYSRV